jgi:hypothetical protein
MSVPHAMTARTTASNFDAPCVRAVTSLPARHPSAQELWPSRGLSPPAIRLDQPAAPARSTHTLIDTYMCIPTDTYPNAYTHKGHTHT